MRKTKIILLIISTAVSLLSLRDKATVVTIPNASPPVAEAYHAPALMQSVLTEPSTISAPGVKPQQQEALSSLVADYPETDPNPIDTSAVSVPSRLEPANPAAPANGAKSKTDNNPSVATSPATVIYGMASIDPPSGTNNNSNNSPVSGTNPIIPNSPAPPPATLSEPVVITGLIPNSGIAGTNVIIQGAGFDSTASNNIVKFGPIGADSVTYVSNNQLRAVVPQGISAGFTNLSVSVSGTTSNSFLFDTLKSSGGNVFIDDTQNLLPAGVTLADSSVVRLGDVDNDNDLDMFVVDASAGKTYLFINDGQGSFTDETSSRLPAIVNPSLITDAIFGDVNKDGYADILLTYSSGQSVRLLLNDGHGKFNDVTSANLPSVSGNAAALDLGDANGDGMPDIIIANKDARDVLLINTGGVFVKDMNFDLPAVIDGSSDIRFCDINGDGSLDIITTNNEVVGSSSLRNRVYVNDGHGNFTDNTQNILPDGNEYSEVLDSGDIDGDGDIDIIVANYSQNAVLINNGSGVFEDQTAARIPTNDFASKDTKLGDFNGDGYLDIVMLGEGKMSLLINDGQGSFKEDSIKLPDYKSTPAILGGKNVQAADINGDGCLDIIVGGSSLHILSSTSVNKGPVLDHIGDKTVNAGKNLTFNVTASDPNGDPLTFFAENLPNGSTFQQQLFNWTPSSGDIGQHKDVRFTAKESDTKDALESSENITITVVGSGLPVIDSHVPDELSLNLTLGQIELFGISAHDPDNKPLTFSWFLNGAEIPSNSGASSSIIFIVPRIGENTIEARVTNNIGTVSLQWNLSVGVTTNHPPQISAYSPVQSDVTIDLTVGGAVNFGITASDPDLDPLTYSWKFDGNVISTTANLSSSAYAAYMAVGNHTIEASVTDGKSAPVTHQWALHITQTQGNRAPIAQNDTATTNINTYVDINVLSNDSDPDGNVISISSIITNPSHGTASIVSGKIRYTPATGYTGTDSFTYQISDGLLTSDAATVTVTIEQSTSAQLIRKTFNYFWNETDNPKTGFTRDRLAVDAANRNSDYDSRYNMASMAATGFSLSAMCVAAEKYGDGSNPDWQITRDQLRARAELIMDKLLEIQGKQDPGDQTTWVTWGRDGFFYHFVNIETGERWTDSSNRSEVSTIDTAILVAGVLTAGEYFGGDLKDKAMQIYRNVNWNAFLDKNLTVPNHHIAANLNYNQMYHAWNPDKPAADRFYGHWDYTSECLLLYLLAAVSPEPGHAIPPETFYAIRKELGNYGANGNPMVKSWFGSLFAYQYTQAFFYFKDAAGQPL